MDPELDGARKGLARAHMARGDWRAARRMLGRAVDVESDSAQWIWAYAAVARRLDDARLARLLTDAGMRRFPEDERFRRLDLELLLGANSPRAVDAARRLVARAPADDQAWRWLAQAYRQADRPAAARAARHAALLCEGPEAESSAAYLNERLAAGDWLTVVERGREMLAGDDARQHVEDTELMEVLIAAAERGARYELMARWVERVPGAQRTRLMHVASARAALRQGRDEDAFRALTRLIEQGEADAAAYMNAAYAAERLGKEEQAVALYREAQAAGGRAARMAPLYLARLHHRQGRTHRARALVQDYLARYPADAEARALLRLMEWQGDE
jgi:tetratricopeptide (TPR) repeat protein